MKPVPTIKFRCPHCDKRGESLLLDSRYAATKNAMRRRRECMECHQRYTTYEHTDNVNAKLIQAARSVTDAVREADNPQKIGNALNALRTVLGE